MVESKKHVLRDQPDGLDPVVVEVWPDGDVVLRQGRDTIQISDAQLEKLINLSD